jgi:hypothetical protein
VRRALALVLVAGCHFGGPSVIGPYARAITRQGNALAVTLCMIQLYDEQLSVGQCYVERVPLPAPGVAYAPRVGRSTATPIAW